MASGLSSPIHRHSSIALVASITEPPPTATSRSALAARAAFAPATTSSRGLWAEMAEWVPTCRAPSAFTRRCSGPSCFCASERVEVTNTRLAPMRSASATTASPAGCPKMILSCAVTLKLPGLMLMRGRLRLAPGRNRPGPDPGRIAAIDLHRPVRPSVRCGFAFRTLRCWRASRQHLGEHLAVDVAAAQDEADALCGHPPTLLHQRRERGGASAFGNVVRVLVEGAHGGGDLVLRDAHDAPRAASDEPQRVLVGNAAGHAVGEGVGPVGRHRAALLEGEGDSRRIGGHHA